MDPRSPIDQPLRSIVDLRALEIFLAVADELHFGRAARRVHLSQPALTAAIARLERALGTRLFERTSRSVALSATGAALEPRARALLADAHDLRVLVARTARGELGSVRVGVVGTAMLGLMPSLVRAVRLAHPGIDLVLREQTGAAQVEDLRAGHLDLGVLHAGPTDVPAGLALLPLPHEQLLIAVPSDHRLAGRRLVRLGELREDPLVVMRGEREADTYGRYVQVCAEAGFAPRIGQLATSLNAVLGYVAAGLGWAFVAASTARGLRRDDIAVLEVHGAQLTLSIALAWSVAGLPPAAATVRDVAARLTGGSRHTN